MNTEKKKPTMKLGFIFDSWKKKMRISNHKILVAKLSEQRQK